MRKGINKSRLHQIFDFQFVREIVPDSVTINIGTIEKITAISSIVILTIFLTTVSFFSNNILDAKDKYNKVSKKLEEQYELNESLSRELEIQKRQIEELRIFIMNNIDSVTIDTILK